MNRVRFWRWKVAHRFGHFVDRFLPLAERCEACNRRVSLEVVEYDVEGVPLCHGCMADLILEQAA